MHTERVLRRYSTDGIGAAGRPLGVTRHLKREDWRSSYQRKEKKHGKPRAMTTLARKIARTVYQMLKRKEAFDAVKFFAN